MNEISNHIIHYLNKFLSDESVEFIQTYNDIQSEDKDLYKSLLCYLDKILTLSIDNKGDELNCNHIHFEYNIGDEIKILIAEFLIIRQFYSNKAEKRLSSENNEQVDIETNKLRNKLKDLEICPEGASAMNGGNKIWKGWKTAKSKTKALIRFYREQGVYIPSSPRTLFNCQVKVLSNFPNLFELKPYAKSVSKSSKLCSPVIYNADSLNNLKSWKINEQVVLKEIEDVILFDCENSVKKFGEFNFSFLNNLNRNHNTNFKNLILITFSKENATINDLRGKLDLIKNRFRTTSNSSYTISLSEISWLLGQPNDSIIQTHFAGQVKSTFWDLFILFTSFRDLYELRSIKMLNLYSLAFNDDIKQYIFDKIFDDINDTSLISYETKQSIAELNGENLTSLKDSLSEAMDVLTLDNWKDKVSALIQEKSEIILPEEAIKDSLLMSMITSALELTRKNKIKSWANIEFDTVNPVLILAYRDQGKYPFHFYPNILEAKFTHSSFVETIFIKCFFYVQFAWANYNLIRDNFKFLKHSIREDFFDWSNLANKLRVLRPQNKDSTFWDLENDYVYSHHRETIRVKFSDVRKSKSFLSSDLFITCLNNSAKYSVEKLSELSSLNLMEESLSIQHLDEIQENINIYEKIIDVEQQKEELQLIRTQFNLDESDPGRLWKVLLKTKAELIGEDELYFDLKSFLLSKNQNIVSQLHFKNTWINPDSESLAPLNKRVFISLCEYLNIPKAYFIIMQRIKNISKQASRQSTRQMNNLLKDLFNDSCFDDITKTEDIINARLNFYKRNHPLDEIGIDENLLLENLKILVELIQPEIQLQEVKSMKIIE